MVLRLVALLLLMRVCVYGTDWWAFQPIEKPRLPEKKDMSEIDALVNAGRDIGWTSYALQKPTATNGMR